MGENNQLSPGQSQLFSGPGEFPKCVMLLVGASGSGKTAYGIQFLREGVAAGDRCVYVNCSPALTQEKFNSYFSKAAPEFVSLFSVQKLGLPDLLWRVAKSLSQSTQTRLVLDSLTDLIARFPRVEVQTFGAELSELWKRTMPSRYLRSPAAHPPSTRSARWQTGFCS